MKINKVTGIPLPIQPGEQEINLTSDGKIYVSKNDGSMNLMYGNAVIEVTTIGANLRFIQADGSSMIIPLPKHSHQISDVTNLEEELEAAHETKRYVHNQMSASDSWEIQHNLDAFPNVFITDSAGSVVYGDIEHIDNNNLRVTFSAGFSGTAHLT